MQPIIIHMEYVSNLSPVFTVKTVIEIRLIRRVDVIAVNAQINLVFRNLDAFRFKFLFDAVIVIIPYRYDILFSVLDFYAHISVFFGKSGKPRYIALFHACGIKLDIRAALRTESALS